MSLSATKAIELVNAINELVKTIEAQNFSASELISRMQNKKMHEVSLSGQYIKSAARKMIKIANARNEKVKGYFNDILLIAGPGYKAEDIETYYLIVFKWMAIEKNKKRL